MYVNATSMRLSRGRSTPTSRAMGGIPSLCGGLFSARSLAQKTTQGSGVRPPFRTKLSWPISKDASRSVVLGDLHSVVCAHCGRWSHGVDPLRPATPSLRSPLALTLLVARIRADHHDPPMPTDHPALVADRLSARGHPHGWFDPVLSSRRFLAPALS